MTLKELSEEYERSAQPLRRRLKELRGQLSQTRDKEDAWRIRRRIAELTPLLTQINEVAWLMKHYYEKGGERDDRYGFNGKRRERKKKNEKKDSPGGRGR